LGGFSLYSTLTAQIVRKYSNQFLGISTAPVSDGLQATSVIKASAPQIEEHPAIITAGDEWTSAMWI
jgi:hypothetical protein